MQTANFIPHIWHLLGYFLSLIWVFAWDQRLLLRINALPHSLHIWPLSCMYSLMYPESITLCKPMFADSTLEWFDACVCPSMSLKSAILCKSLTTLCTFVRLLACMCPFMLLEYNTLCKWLVAMCALIGFDSCMCPFMVNKNTTMCKWLVAICTMVWFDSCMCPFMPLESSTLCKWLVAMCALVRFDSRMCPFMSLKMILSCKSLATCVTFWMVSLLYVSSHVSQDCSFLRISCHICHIWINFCLCVFFHEPSCNPSMQTSYHKFHTDIAFDQYYCWAWHSLVPCTVYPSCWSGGSVHHIYCLAQIHHVEHS